MRMVVCVSVRGTLVGQRSVVICCVVWSLLVVWLYIYMCICRRVYVYIYMCHLVRMVVCVGVRGWTEECGYVLCGIVSFSCVVVQICVYM